MNRGSRHGEL